MSTSIKSFTAEDGTNWHYYSGSFWATAIFKDNICLIACPANTDGTPDIYIEDMTVNACDVEECEQHHLDFVNSTFGTKFELRGTDGGNSGHPSYG